jgi:murein DD-endopeptidase MepM/ murein hydrolase activator NlpD
VAAPVGTPNAITGDNAMSTALSYMKSVMESNARADSPYSGYAEGLQGTPYGGYAAGNPQNSQQPVPTTINSDSPLNPDRQPSQILTEKEIRRKLSRRGGFGLFGARSPLQGFDYDADRNSFGSGVDPIDGGMRNHTGEDLGAAMGTPIYAPVGGTVSTATPNGGAYGNQIILDHGRGEQTMYGHLANMNVQPGDKIRKGDLIGYVGSTGRSTGPHLHWETWKDGQALDPNTLFGREIPEDILRQAMLKYGAKHNGPVESVTQPEEPQQDTERLAQNDGLDALMKAIRQQESGNDYSVQNGIGAMGAYQVMPSNIEGPAGWDMEVLGQNITGQEFLNSPVLQDKIAKFKLRDYFKKYGAGGAAKAWYAGPGNADLNSNAPQSGGPSVNGYAESVLDLMRKYM